MTTENDTTTEQSGNYSDDEKTVTVVLLGNLGDWDEYVLLQEGDEPFNWNDMTAEYVKVVCVSAKDVPSVLDQHELERQ